MYAHEVSGTTKITCTVDGISRTCEVTVRVTVDDFDIWFPDVNDIYSLEYEYKGTAWEPEPNVNLLEERLELGKDYTLSYRDNVNVGTATMTITGKGAYTGTKEISFKITPLQIAFPDYTGNLFCDVAFSKDSYTYTGKPVEPKPVITYTGGFFYEGETFELVEGKDYKLSYQNNVDPGYATIIVTGINNCEGEFEEEFFIDPEPIISQKDISLVTVAPIEAVNYTGKAQEPKPVVTYQGLRLEEGVDYNLSYKNNVDPGTATVTLTGIGEYKGTKAATFTIMKTKINLADVSIAKVADRTYTGQAIKPTPDVTYQGAKLTAGTDFAFSYDNNVNAGTASLTITGKGNYTGSKSVTFRIVKIDTVVMHRLYNPNSGEHFYTADGEERDHLVKVGWRYEGVGWVAPAKSQTPVHRLYNPVAGEHHYTSDLDERNMLVRAGWNYEGVGWYSDDAKSVPLYRQYNPNAFACNHNYTTDKEENDHLVSLGWRYEGIGWYGV